MNCRRLERTFFRKLNAVVEPAVRKGVGSPSLTPGSIIVLESTGYKSGQPRRTPLLALHLGRYVFVSTVRGDRSFWIKNLQKQPLARYYLGGKAREAKAFVVAYDLPYRRPRSLPPIIANITDRAARYARFGWAFAVLMPVQR